MVSRIGPESGVVSGVGEGEMITKAVDSVRRSQEHVVAGIASHGHQAVLQPVIG